MMKINKIILLSLLLFIFVGSNDTDAQNLRADGYKGIWFTLGQFSEYGVGGEIAMWISKDEWQTWKKIRNLTKKSVRNNSYVRRPLNAHKDFYSFWADGDADKLSESHLYFSNKKGNEVWELPYEMKEKFRKPIKIK